MKSPRAHLRASLFVAGVLAVLPLVPVMAQDAWPVPRIAVVDIQGILREASAGRAARARLEEIAGDVQADLNAKEQTLRQEEQALQQQRAILSAEAFAERRRAWQENAAALQREAENFRGRLDESFNGAMKKMHAVLLEEISDMARARGVNMVLPRSEITIVLVANDLDLTGEALERLNARMPTIAVEFGAEAAQ